MAYDYSAKCVILGDTGVGKSSLLLALTDPGRFSSSHDVTIGVEFGAKNVSCEGGQVIKLQIWDTAGQEAFRSIVRTYYRATAAALVVFDVGRRASLASVDSWLRDLREHCAVPAVRVLLVGNKCDLDESRREVSTDEAAAFAAERGLEFVETSARTGRNVAAAFKGVAQTVVDDVLAGRLDPLATPSQGVKLGHSVAAAASRRRADDDNLRLGQRSAASRAVTPNGGCCVVS